MAICITSDARSCSLDVFWHIQFGWSIPCVCKVLQRNETFFGSLCSIILYLTIWQDKCLKVEYIYTSDVDFFSKRQGLSLNITKGYVYTLSHQFPLNSACNTSAKECMWCSWGHCITWAINFQAVLDTFGMSQEYDIYMYEFSVNRKGEKKEGR